MFPVRMDSWSRYGVTAIPTIIRSTAPIRSGQGALLRKTHQTTMASAPRGPPTTAKDSKAGATMGRVSQVNHCISTTSTPGHTRSGPGRVDSTVCAWAVMVLPLLLEHPYGRAGPKGFPDLSRVWP